MKIEIIVIKKSAKLEKIHRSMKHGKMIKMLATGTGAKQAVIGWLLCLGAGGFLLQTLLQTSTLRSLPWHVCA